MVSCTSSSAKCIMSPPPPPSVSASPSDNLQLGSSATLQCQVKGLPELAVQWRKPDGSLHPQVTQLNPVARSDEGAWNCIVSHDGEMYSEKLDIKGGSPASAKRLQQKSCSGSKLLFQFQNPPPRLSDPSLLRRTTRSQLATTVGTPSICLWVLTEPVLPWMCH